MADMLPEGGFRYYGQRDKDADAVIAAEDAAPTTGDQKFTAFAEGIARDNYTSRFIRSRVTIGNPFEEDLFTFIDQPTFEPDPGGYRFEDDERNLGYDPGQMYQAQSAAEAQSFRDQIDKERVQLEMINQSSWGVAGQAYGGIFQPHVAAAIALSPISVPGMLAIEGAGEIASETMLHQMEKTRTIEESYMNVGLTLATVGILGGAAKYMTREAQAGSRGHDVIDQINSGEIPASSFGGDSAGAARAVSDDLTAEEDALVGGWMARKFSIGQMSHLLHSASDTARSIATRLADNPFFTKGMAEGKTRGVTVESLQEAATGRVVIATEAVTGLAKQSGLGQRGRLGFTNYDAFNEEVGKAMSAGDRHANPQVQAAAELFRRDVLDPIREASERLGLLESVDELKIKINDLEVDIKARVASTADLKARVETVEADRATYVKSREKELGRLERAVAAQQKKLDKARTPDAMGNKGTATKEQIAKHNDARTALTAHKKESAAAVSGYRKTAKELRKEKMDLAKSRRELREAKTKQKNPVSFAESYFPRVYNTQRLLENWDAVKFKIMDMLKQNPKIVGNLDPAEIEAMAIDTMQNMMSGRSQMIHGDGTPSPLRARVLGLYDQELEALGIVEKNATQAMLRHSQAMNPYLLVRELFDGRTFDEMMTQIDDEYAVLLNKGVKKEASADPHAKVEPAQLSDAERKRLHKEWGADKARLKVVHDRLMHQVQRTLQPGSAWQKTVQFVKVWNTAAYLGGIVFSSMADIARPLANYGFRSYMKGIAMASTQVFAGKGSMQSIQVKRTGAALQRTLNDRMQQLTDSLEPMGKVTGGMQKIWEKTSGFSVYTDIMESITAQAAMDWTLRMANRTLDGKVISKGEIKQLARMGLTSEDLALIARESAGTMGAQDTVLKYMNTMEWQDMDLAKRVEAAIGSDVRRTIIRIGAGEKPAMMDDTTISALFQFQTFAMSAQNKIMVAGIQNITMKRTAESLIAMQLLGGMVAAGKATARGDDVSDWPPGKWFTESWDRSGMTGILRLPFNALLYAGAQTDAGEGMFGEPTRFLNREVQGMIAGPTVSSMGNIANAYSAGIAGDTEKAGEHLLKGVPYANTMHIRDVLLTLGDN